MPQLFDTPAGPVATGHNAPIKSVRPSAPLKQSVQQQPPSTTTTTLSLEAMQQQQLVQMQMQQLTLQPKLAATPSTPNAPAKGYAQNMLTYAYPPQTFQNSAPPSTTTNSNRSTVPNQVMASNPFEPTPVAQRIDQLLKLSVPPAPVPAPAPVVLQYPPVNPPIKVAQPVSTPQYIPATQYPPPQPFPYGGRMALPMYNVMRAQQQQQQPQMPYSYPPPPAYQQQQQQQLPSRPAWK